jgi:hypothetical protein
VDQRRNRGLWPHADGVGVLRWGSAPSAALSHIARFSHGFVATPGLPAQQSARVDLFSQLSQHDLESAEDSNSPVKLLVQTTLGHLPRFGRQTAINSCGGFGWSHTLMHSIEHIPKSKDDTDRPVMEAMRSSSRPLESAAFGAVGGSMPFGYQVNQ